MWRIWMSDVRHVNKSCHVWTSHFAYEWVMPYKWMSHVVCMSHVTHMSESYYTYDYAFHKQISHVTHMNGSCRRCMTRIKPVNESCHTFWGATQLWRSCEWEGFQINCSSSDLKGVLTGVTSMSHATPNSKSCPIKSHVKYEWVISHIYLRVMSHQWVMSYMNESCHTYEWVMSHQRVMLHVNESCPTYK
jgi:hypothetical protein